MSENETAAPSWSNLFARCAEITHTDSVIAAALRECGCQNCLNRVAQMERDKKIVFI